MQDKLEKSRTALLTADKRMVTMNHRHNEEVDQ